MSDHVEVLRHMKETIKAIMPSEVAALDAAIAALSAPPSAPVGVEKAAREVIESIGRFRDDGTRPGEGTLVYWEATLHRALAQQPAACPRCDGTGEADSGGIHPWGAPAMIRCECQHPAAVDGAGGDNA